MRVKLVARFLNFHFWRVWFGTERCDLVKLFSFEFLIFSKFVNATSLPEGSWLRPGRALGRSSKPRQKK
jgi:hypothetical protein